MNNVLFVVNAIGLGIGLAMDAFSVSLANGLNEPLMKNGRMMKIAGTFAFFQWFMPMVGWLLVTSFVQYFNAFSHFIPWIALILLLFIGGKMIKEAFDDEEEEVEKEVGKSTLFMQGIATSIDALSVGFTISEYNLMQAFMCSVIIAIVTFGICYVGIKIGKKFGMKLAGKASIFGGVILIAIGLEIFIKGMM